MNTIDSYKTRHSNKETVTKEWMLIDAENEVLGRLASKAAKILRGKHKTEFSPHVDCGDNVIVINADKVKLTGNKWSDKTYIRYSGYPGGQKELSAEEMMKKEPRFLIEHAIKGMLPKNKLGSQLFRNLHVYGGNEHPHSAQKPKSLKLDSIK